MRRNQSQQVYDDEATVVGMTPLQQVQEIVIAEQQRKAWLRRYEAAHLLWLCGYLPPQTLDQIREQYSSSDFRVHKLIDNATNSTMDELKVILERGADGL